MDIIQLNPDVQSVSLDITVDIHTVSVTVNTSQSGSRAFLVTAAQLWNTLPDDITLADSLWTFQRQPKHYLFSQSYPDVVL